MRVYSSNGPDKVCSNGAVGTACDSQDDADCAEGRCAKDSAGAGWTCSAGGLGDRCSAAGHCIASECALAADGGGYCSDGSTGSACANNAQCDMQRCAIGAGYSLG